MEISSNSLNQPVNFYTKNTGNNINMAIDNENQLYGSNVFSSEIFQQELNRHTPAPVKKRRKSKRLNTYDSEYLPDETIEDTIQNKDNNFFLEKEQNSIKNNLKKALEHFVTATPLVNYFFLKRKNQQLKKTVETLNDISQDVDELMNTAIPYGENSEFYGNIAKNLTKAASILGRTNKELKKS